MTTANSRKRSEIAPGAVYVRGAVCRHGGTRLTLEHGDILPLEEIVSARFVLDAQAITGEDS